VKVLHHNLPEDLHLGCITQHPGFRVICLEPWVLRVAYLEYKQHHGHLEDPHATKFVCILHCMIVLMYSDELCIRFTRNLI
jgi:hypothetical protein